MGGQFHARIVSSMSSQGCEKQTADAFLPVGFFSGLFSAFSFQGCKVCGLEIAIAEHDDP